MVKIVVDSGCDFNQELRKQKNENELNAHLVSLNLQLGDVEYVDDEDLDVNTYLDAVSASPVMAKTSAPSPKSYFDKYLGSESVFAVTLSSRMSGSYNSAMLAKQMYLDEIGNKFIHVFDSLSASVAETLIMLKINEFAKKGLSDIEIVDSINKFISSMHTYFILEKLDNLVKTGRMNPYVAKIASILSIKPICTATSIGTIEMADKARGYKKAVARLLEIMTSQKIDCENRILGIAHVRCLDKALAFKEEVMKKMNFKDIVIVETGGLCSTYANDQGIIISY